MIFEAHNGIRLGSTKLFYYPDEREVAIIVKTLSKFETLCKDIRGHSANSSTCSDEERQRFESFGEFYVIFIFNEM